MKRFYTLVVSLLVSLLAGLAVPGLWADDTDLYISQTPAISTETRANILFILDASSSMLLPVPDQASGVPLDQATGKPMTGGKSEVPLKRIDVLRNALMGALDEMDNLNVGLGRFTRAWEKGKDLGRPIDKMNAAIIYPVAYIDAALAEIEAGGTDKPIPIPSSVPIAEGGDDAEENVLSGSVDVTSKILEMTQLAQEESPPGGGKKVEVRVNTSFDDAKEIVNDTGSKDYPKGSVVRNNYSLALGGSGLEMESNDPYHIFDGETLIGLRFAKQEDGTPFGIPQGATITKAEVVFIAQHNDENRLNTDPLDLTISAGVVDPTVAPDKNVWRPVDSGTAYALSSFKKIGKTVTWSKVPVFEDNKAYASADIATLVQEIVDQGCTGEGDAKTCTQPGWTGDKQIAVFFERKRTESDGSPVAADKLTKGMRVVKSVDELASDAPLLRIWWYVRNQTTSALAIDPSVDMTKLDPTKTCGAYSVSSTDYGDMERNCQAMFQPDPKVAGNQHSVGQTSFIFLGDGRDNRKNALTAVRFPQVDVPKNATIKEAKITFTRNGTTSSPDTNATWDGNPLAMKVTAEKVDKASMENAKKISMDIGTDAKGGTADDNPETPLNKDARSTSANVEWDIPLDVAVGKPFSVDVPNIVQELVKQEGWQSSYNYVPKAGGNSETRINKSMVFLFKKNPDAKTFSATARRRIVSVDDIRTANNTMVKPTLQNIPRLDIKYSLYDPLDEQATTGTSTTGGTQATADKQIVGLRFTNVGIPQGAKVISASINFKSGPATSAPANLMIQVEDVNDAAPFAMTKKNISSRALYPTPAMSWSNVPAWDENGTYSSPSVKDLVQYIVNKKEWCGGRDSIAFVISSDAAQVPLRNAYSFNDSPDRAPVLNVEYDAREATGCLNQIYTQRISAGIDDAEEFTLLGGTPSGVVRTKGGGNTIELTNNISGGAKNERIVGLRFPDVPLDANAQVLHAYLVFVASGKDDAPVTLTIRGEKGNAGEFHHEAIEKELSNRQKTSASVEWPLTTWELGRQYKTVDIAPIVKEILNGSWEAFNDMAFYIQHKEGVGYRRAYSFDLNAALAPRLLIQIEGTMGEGGAGGLKTVRQRLKELVRSFEFGNYTPMVDALYESAQYYAGKEVTFGKDRNLYSKHLVSHPSTYKNGTLVRPNPLCNDSDLYNKNCEGEKIDGTPVYVSPINTDCQRNYIVLITDGAPTSNSGTDGSTTKDLASKLTSKTCVKLGGKAADGKLADPEVASKGECGPEIVKFLHDNNFGKNAKGKTIDGSNVITHTIGFQLGTAYMQKKDDAGNLLGKDGKPLDKSLTYNQKLALSDWIIDTERTNENESAVRYLQMLAEASAPEGKFFDAQTEQDLKAAFKSIVVQAVTSSTSFAAPSISVSAANRMEHNEDVYYALFKPANTQRWHGNIKKFHICKPWSKCAAGDVLDTKGESAVDSSTRYISKDAKSFWSSDVDGSTITKGGAGEREPSASDRRIYTYIGTAADAPTSGDPGSWIALKDYNIGQLLSSDSSLSGDEKKQFQKLLGTTGSSATNELISWIRGKDVKGENSGEEGDRWKFADPLHSSPYALSYSKDDKTKLFVGTNDGLVRMINAEDDGPGGENKGGNEEWAFLPQELLSIQSALMENAITGERLYGMDGSPSFWIKDGGDKIINPGTTDFARMFMGMRRGGRNIYALDVTIPDDPKLMWVIKGGTDKGSTEGFEKLGQTWSLPKVTRILWQGSKGLERKTVLLFGGGYDTKHDEGFYGTSSMGNAIYMVDPLTGTRLWWAGSDTSEADLKLADMKFAIPSDLGLVDSDGDGNTDRIYVGDVGGQVWRVDLAGIGDSSKGVGGVLAKIGESAKPNNRRFFYPPSVVRLNDSECSDPSKYDMVTIATGTRPEPLETTVENRFYAFRDRAINGLAAVQKSLGAGQPFPECQVGPKTEGGSDDPLFCTIKEPVMYPIAYSYNAAQDGITLKVKEESAGDFKKAKGWYFDLPRSGEKALASTLILNGNVYFTTYIPDKEVVKDSCGGSEGKSRLYEMDLVTGGTACDGSGKEQRDPSMQMRAGITSDISLLILGNEVRLIANDLGLSKDGVKTPRTSKPEGDPPGDPGNPDDPNNPDDDPSIPLLDNNCPSGSTAVYCRKPEPTFWQQE